MLLSQVIADGTLAARPAASIDGRLYFATDVKMWFRDNGASWEDVTPSTPAAALDATSSAPGNFSMPHGLGSAPSRISILMTSAGSIWAQPTSADATNVNLVASDSGLTAIVYVFA